MHHWNTGMYYSPIYRLKLFYAMNFWTGLWETINPCSIQYVPRFYRNFKNPVEAVSRVAKKTTDKLIMSQKESTTSHELTRESRVNYESRASFMHFESIQDNKTLFLFKIKKFFFLQENYLLKTTKTTEKSYQAKRDKNSTSQQYSRATFWNWPPLFALGTEIPL